MSSSWVIQTGRLVMTPVGGGDLDALVRLKADPRVFAVMLGGVRTSQRTQAELADDLAFWARCGVGMWSVRAREASGGAGRFLGVAGLMDRPDGRGLSLRFALCPEERGRGLASEAAGAALRFAHDRAGVERVIAVAREDNFASRTVLGGIGMRQVEAESFLRDGHQMLVYESVRRESRGSASGGGPGGKAPWPC